MTDIDAQIAARLPKEWAKENDPTLRNRSKARNNLRKRYKALIALEDLKAKHPEADCSNCVNASPWGPEQVMSCDLDSDFHGYRPITPEHVCYRWKGKRDD